MALATMSRCEARWELGTFRPVKDWNRSTSRATPHRRPASVWLVLEWVHQGVPSGHGWTKDLRSECRVSRGVSVQYATPTREGERYR